MCVAPEDPCRTDYYEENGVTKTVCTDDQSCKVGNTQFKHCPKNKTQNVIRKVVEPEVYVCEHTMAPTITYKSVLNGGRIDQESTIRAKTSEESGAGTCEVSLTDLQGLNNQDNCPGGVNGGLVFHYVVEF